MEIGSLNLCVSMLSITIIFGSNAEIFAIKTLSFPEHPRFMVGLTTSSTEIPFGLNLTGLFACITGTHKCC